MIPFHIVSDEMSLSADRIWSDHKPNCGKRHREQLAAAGRSKPDGPQTQETRQQRRRRERQEGKRNNA